MRKSRVIIKVVDLEQPSASIIQNYAEGLVTQDKDNRLTPCLAEDWRWVDDRTIEFRLREGVRFHNGEKFNAEAVKVNWEAYKAMEIPRPYRFTMIADETEFSIIDEFTVRFTFPEPDGLAFIKFRWFFQIAPAFFEEHKFDEKNWGYLPVSGPWGTGPFELVEGHSLFYKASDRVVLEAYERYWDPQYPKVKRVVFDNSLIGDREEAMRLCMEQEGAVDIVNRIRPLDTLKVAESLHAKMVKCRSIAVLGGYLNMRKKDSKWRDIRLRKALNYAVNRHELWKYGAKGNAYNLEGLELPPGAYGYNPDLPGRTYDTEKARSLLEQAGYPDGFEIKIITLEALKLETQIILKMLERVGLKAELDVLAQPEFWRKFIIPMIDKSPEEQDWDIAFVLRQDWYGHTGATLLGWGYIEMSDLRWIEFDLAYEEMWKNMARTVDLEVQEEKVRQMAKYISDHIYGLYVYSPLSLYAVNKEVDSIPQKFPMYRLKETSVTDKHWSVRGQSESSQAE